MANYVPKDWSVGDARGIELDGKLHTGTTVQLDAWLQTLTDEELNRCWYVGPDGFRATLAKMMLTDDLFSFSKS